VSLVLGLPKYVFGVRVFLNVSLVLGFP
jgi:hypothetical protein